MSTGMNRYYFLLLVCYILQACSNGAEEASFQRAPAPTNIRATSNANVVQLNWPNVTSAASYNLYWSEDANSAKNDRTLVQNVQRPYVQTIPSSIPALYYWISSVNKKGESDPSAPLLVVVSPKLEAIPGNGKNRISGLDFSAVTYTVYWSTKLEFTEATAEGSVVTSLPFKHGPLVNGQDYYLY